MMHLLLMMWLQCSQPPIVDHPANALTWAARQFKDGALVVVSLPGEDTGTNLQVCSQMWEMGEVVAQHCWKPKSRLEADEWHDYKLAGKELIVVLERQGFNGMMETWVASRINGPGVDPVFHEEEECPQ